MNTYTFGGKEGPRFDFLDGTFAELPVPNGFKKEGLRQYEFEHIVADEFRSEGRKFIEVGKVFRFKGKIAWLKLDTIYLQKLWKAEKQPEFKFTPNKDKEEVWFNCRLKVSFIYALGLIDGLFCYTVSIELQGTDELDKPSWGRLPDPPVNPGGYGSDYGGDTENQSP